MITYPTSVSPNNFILGDDGVYVATILASTHGLGKSVYITKSVHRNDDLSTENVESDGMNYAWTGSEWDALGGSVDLSGYVTTAQMNSALAGKVDAVEGKGLSTNDYTTADKNKLAGLSAPTKQTFVAGGWGNADTDGYYSMTISASGKYPVKVMRNISGVYTEAVVQAAVSGANVILTSEEAFEGYIILI